MFSKTFPLNYYKINKNENSFKKSILTLTRQRKLQYINIFGLN